MVKVSSPLPVTDEITGCFLNHPTQQNLFDTESLPPDQAPWELAAQSDRMAAQVVFNRPLETLYSYLIPDNLREIITPGQRMKVPFGRGDRLTVGYCVDVVPPPKTSRKLKSIESVIDRVPLLSPNMLKLTRWIAEHYLCGWGQVLETVVPAGVKKKAGTRSVTFVEAASNTESQRSKLSLPAKQRAVLEVLCSGGHPMRIGDLADAAGCGTGPINALREKGLIQAIHKRTDTKAIELKAVEKVADLLLNDDQQKALDRILDELRSGKHRTILLHGVTGSGKTEVYIQAIREVVAYGRQAIVLVPEISLTPQTIRRFRSRFDSVAVLHSHLSDAERHRQWQQIAAGNVQVVVGARSAVFAPTPHLGLIVIDEEHETTFKQETTPRYHAREVARQRAKIENIPLILGSATPTLESWQRVQKQQDILLSLPKRVQKLPMPPVVVVDIRNDPNFGHGAAIGRALESSMRLALDDGGQVILLLNLRGYAPTMWCRTCGETVKCPHCDITLTWHKDRNVALCHCCDFKHRPLTKCPGCGKPGMRYLGIGTQRLEQEVKARFGQYKSLRMDSDSMRKPGSHDVALEKFSHGEVQILLGTQMIAKGLDFPNVTLVGVISADTILHQPDIRAAERTFQLIAQVAGRTGRSSRGGRVFVQTTSPAEPAIRAAAEHDYLKFARLELEHRRITLVPPFQSLARVVLRGKKEEAVKQFATEVADLLRRTCEETKTSIRILGPAPAPIAKLKNNYRYHLQLAADTLEPIQQIWRKILPRLPKSNQVDLIIDVDPVDMR